MVSESYGTIALSESAMRSSTPAGSSDRQQALVDLEQAPLALELVLELLLLAPQALEVARR